ncbi:hypothetical protein KEM56_005612 [Ascosphaera pollenicola]|nr:hypothetical protein KEM56_005612 [Ascosphaera pollenicola]
MTKPTSVEHTPSPGNAYYPDTPPMRKPHLEFVYRLEADMAMGPNSGYEISKPNGGGTAWSVGNIQSGTVKGPGINGIVLPNSGADWAEELYCDKVFYRLNARYAIKTDDGHFIIIEAHGIFRLGPGVEMSQEPPEIESQDMVEYFSHLTFKAGEGPYNWMNNVVCVGSMQMVKNTVCIDCYRLTNFPGVPAEDLKLEKESKIPPRPDL